MDEIRKLSLFFFVNNWSIIDDRKTQVIHRDVFLLTSNKRHFDLC